jgi:trimethylamine:corrinoid methyltransferase-like protein
MEVQRNFMAQSHTVKYLRSGEILYETLGIRETLEQWNQKGRIGLAERARLEADRLLREHEVPPLSENQEIELDRIIAAAEKEIIRK